MAISLPPQSVFIWGGSAVPGHQLTAYATQPRPQSASALAPFTGVKDRDSRTCAAESTTLSFPVSTVSDTLLMECGDDGTPAFGNATGKSVVIPEAASVAPTRPSSASRPSCGAAASPDCCSSAADYRPYLAFFSPLRLKGLAAGDRGEAHADGDWVTQTAARSCPVLVKESLVVNDKVGLAVGADGRLRLWFCSERPCLVRPALALYSPYPVPFSGFCTPVCSPTSPAPSPEDGSSDPGRSSSVPGSLVGGTRLEYRIWPRPLPYPLLHLQGASSAWPGAGGIKQLALSSSRCFLLTSEGLLYSSFLPHAVSPSTPSPERCPSVSSPGKHSLSSSASPFSPGGTSERAKPTGVDAGGTCGNPVTSLRCPVSPCFLGGRNRDTREAPTATAPRPPHTTALSQLRFSSNASSSFVNSSSHSPSCPHFRGHAGYPWTVYLVFSPVRDICNISSFSCSDSHTAAIVDTHAPAFRLSSAPEPSGCFSSNRSSTHTGPPSLGACAAQAILRSSRGLPPSPSFVLDVLAPLSVSVRNSSLFDFCCLYLLFNLPLLLSFPLASDAVSRLVKRAILLPQGDLMPLTGTDSYLPASAGMQYLLRALKAALTTASLGAETLESWLSLASTLFFFDRVVSEPSDCGRRVAVHRTEEVASVVSTGHTDANKENQSIVKNDSNHTRSRPEVCRSADDSPPSASRRRSESGTRQQEMELLDLRTGCAVQQREALSDSAAAPEQMQTRTAYGTDSRTHLCAEGERDVRLARTLDCATLPKMSRKEEGRSTPAILHESDSFSRSGAALLSGTDRAAKDTFAREEGAEALQLWEELEQMWFPNSRVLRPALASAAMELSTLLRGKLESPTFSLQSDLLDENTSSALSLRGSAGGEHARPRFGEEPYAGSVSSSEDGLACTSLFAPAEKGPILLLVLPRRASDLLMADGRLRRERRLLLDKWTRAYWATEDEEPGAVVRKARGLEKTAQTGKQEKHGKEFFAEATCVSVADAEGSSCGQGENGGKEEEKTLGQHRGQRPTGKSKGNTIDRDASGRNGRCLDSCETEPPVHQDEEKTFRSLPECVEISRAGADNKSTTESVRAAPCVRADRFLVPMRDTDYAVGCSDSRLSRASHVTEGNGGTSGNTRGGVSSRHRAGFLEASCGPFPVAAADGTGIRGTPLVGHSRMRPSHASASGDISGDSPCSGVASWSPCSSLVSGVETVQEVSVLGGSEVKEIGELRTTRDASALSATGTNHTEEWTEEEKQTGFSWQKVKHRKKRVEAASERELVGDGTATRQNTITGSPVEMHSYTKEIRSQESPATRASKEKKNESHRPDQAATDVGKSPWIRLPKSARNSRTACTSPVMMWGPSKDSPFQSPSILPPCSSRPSSSFASSEGNSDVPRDVRSVFRLCDFLVTTGTKKKSRKGSALEVTSRASPFSGEEGTSAWRPGTHGAWKTVKENCIAGDTANTAGEEKLSTDLASVMQEEEALHEAKQLKLRLLQEQEQAHEASSVVRSPGLPSIVFVPRQSAAGGFTSCGRGRAVVHRNQARGGSAGRLLANCRDHTASFNCWGKEAALRAQGEESLVTDLKIIQMQQSREHEEEQVRLREEAEVQEALRLVDEMEKREREAARQLKREMDRAAAKERSRAQRQTRGGSRGSRWTGRTYGPGE
ncbi:chromosome condensation regulator repeat protein [Cystoisospora suis]|uniref:Chromosome condensation regulator repeat protein n=1 Tax=Cystoisospora suis TaxID=483139 RepID=A0A2C6LD60_9APIC|nr:chromosome condensation regulator repeat protein [Cystoisospora suis]